MKMEDKGMGKHEERKNKNEDGRKRNGGVWKKVKSKGMEDSGRYICVWRRKLGKNKKEKKIIV